MNINDLIGADPKLLQRLLDLGLSHSQVDDLGLLISAQLAEHSGLDLGVLLGKLSSESFRLKLDIRNLAGRLGADVPTVQAALLLLGSAVARFGGGVANRNTSEIE